MCFYGCKPLCAVDDHHLDLAFANVVNGPLRTELGCFPPACTIDVVATGNTIRIVATDVAPNSRLAARAEAMDSTALGIALDAAPDIHLIRTVTVVREVAREV